MTTRRCILPPAPDEPADSLRPTCTDLPPAGCSDEPADEIDCELRDTYMRRGIS